MGEPLKITKIYLKVNGKMNLEKAKNCLNSVPVGSDNQSLYMRINFSNGVRC